jgi:probable F420-dependent oxidoreductase
MSAARRLVRVGLGPAGVPAIRQPADRERFVAFVRRAEEIGYTSVCVGDHLDDRGAPLLLLATAASETQRLTLATHVLCNELRNAAVVAQEARTLQVLSGGRLELGLGTGWLQRDFEVAGIEMAPFRQRLARLTTTVARVRETAAGSELRAPPIVMGGGGAEMLGAAARLADIVTVNIPLRSRAGLATNTVASGTRSAFEERLRIVRDGADAARRTVELHVYVHHVHCGDRWREEASDAAERLGLDLDTYTSSPHVLAGDVDEIVATMTNRCADLGLGYVSVPGSCLEALAPVVARLR